MPPNIAAPMTTLASDRDGHGADPEHPQRDQRVVTHPPLGEMNATRPAAPTT